MEQLKSFVKSEVQKAFITIEKKIDDAVSMVESDEKDGSTEDKDGSTEDKDGSTEDKDVSMEEKTVSDKGKKVVGTLRLKNLSKLKEAVDAQPHPVKEEVIDLVEEEIQITSISQPVIEKMLHKNVRYLDQLRALLKQ